MKPLLIILLALLLAGPLPVRAESPQRCCETEAILDKPAAVEPAPVKVRDTFTQADRTVQKARLRSLAGKWVNTHPDLKLESICGNEAALRLVQAQVHYHFVDDGTFRRVLSSKVDAEQRYEETGRWTVSPDGRQLLLYRTTDTGAVLTTRASNKYLEHDEMVLSHPIASVGDHQVADLDADLFFNKH